MKTRSVLTVLAMALTLGFLPAGTSAGPPVPILIQEQGSFFVGGVPFITDRHTTVVGAASDPGTTTINQSYVKFQIPHVRKSLFPVILFTGGGHTGAVYETTPDGREGWANHFVRTGFPVYNPDGVNRGGSSWDLTGIAQVAQGDLPIADITSINRRHHAQAWTGFRIGPALGIQNPGGQFPVEAFEHYTNQLVPAFRDAIEDVKNSTALVALLDKIGPSIVVTWSQSGRFGASAAVQRPDLVKALILLEPAAVSQAGVMTGISQADWDSISHIPILLEVGDFDPVRVVRQRNFCNTIGNNCTLLELTELGIFGNGHVVMVEKNNLQVADVIIDWLKMMLGKHPKHP